MKRKEFLERLEQLLGVLPQEEREEALQFYTDYFDDAGMENEEIVIRELGSPEEVAAKIRAGFGGDYGEYSEQGYEDVRFENSQGITPVHRYDNSDWTDSVYEAQQEDSAKSKSETSKKHTNVWKIIAIVLLLIFATPIILPLGIAIITVIFAIVVALFTIVAALGLSGFAIAFSGIIVAAAGIAKMMLTPPIGILALGIGCVLFAIGILVSWFIIMLSVKIVPSILRSIVKILGMPFRKAGAGK